MFLSGFLTTRLKQNTHFLKKQFQAFFVLTGIEILNLQKWPPQHVTMWFCFPSACIHIWKKIAIFNFTWKTAKWCISPSHWMQTFCAFHFANWHKPKLFNYWEKLKLRNTENIILSCSFISEDENNAIPIILILKYTELVHTEEAESLWAFLVSYDFPVLCQKAFCFTANIFWVLCRSSAFLSQWRRMMSTSASATIVHEAMNGARVKRICVGVQHLQVKLWLAPEGSNASPSDLSKADVPEVTSMSKNGLAILWAA